MPQPSLIKQVTTSINEMLLFLALGAILGVFSTITGCTTFVMKQMDQDVATSTSEPLESFRAATAHANQFIAKNRGDEYGDYDNDN